MSRSRIILIIFTILYFLLGFGALMIAPFSVMAFDAPGSNKMLAPWLFMIGMFSLPVSFALAIVLAWIFHLLKLFKVSWLMLLLPLLSIATVMATFFVGDTPYNP